MTSPYVTEQLHFCHSYKWLWFMATLRHCEDMSRDANKLGDDSSDSMLSYKLGCEIDVAKSTVVNYVHFARRSRLA
jgi:hypothetical protein